LVILYRSTSDQIAAGKHGLIRKTTGDATTFLALISVHPSIAISVPGSNDNVVYLKFGMPWIIDGYSWQRFSAGNWNAINKLMGSSQAPLELVTNSRTGLKVPMTHHFYKKVTIGKQRNKLDEKGTQL
jgi:hypothetical protein